jgi:hypothetical protein
LSKTIYFHLIFLSLFTSESFATFNCEIESTAPEGTVREAQLSVDQLLRSRERPTCKTNQILNCALFENSPTPFIQLGNGKSIPNLTLAAPPVQEDQVQPELIKFQATFEEVKNSLLELILAGKSRREDLDPYRRALYDRMNTISFKGLAPEGLCRSSRPNAKYNGAAHSFIICPGFLKVDKVNLIRVVAHELSHSIDFCTMMGSMYERNLSTFPKTASYDPYFTTRSPYLVTTPNGEAAISPADSLNLYIQQGHLKILDNGGDPKLYPLASSVSCLKKLKGETDILPSREECALNTTSASEDSADIWSARVVGKYLKDHPFQNELERQAFFFEAVQTICKPQIKSMKTGGGAAGVHSSDTFRIDEIFLSNPDIQSAMGCEPLPHSCEVR